MLKRAIDLRTSVEDKSQRTLNALISGTEVPIHCHPKSSETVVLLYDYIDEIYFDTEGQDSSRSTIHVGDSIQIPLGQFHTIKVHEPFIILEVKYRAYEPAQPEDII